jgi:hypothetical protein
MSYSSISQMKNDPALRERINACCAQEGYASPEQVANQIMWQCVSHSDWASAYEQALLDLNRNPGGDGRVITDQMILSAVQSAVVPEQTSPGG